MAMLCGRAAPLKTPRRISSGTRAQYSLSPAPVSQLDGATSPVTTTGITRCTSIVGSQGGRGGGGGPPGGGSGSRSHSSQPSTMAHSLPTSMPTPSALRAGIATSIGPAMRPCSAGAGALGKRPSIRSTCDAAPSNAAK